MSSVRLKRLASFVARLGVAAVCLWYVSLYVTWAELISAIGTLDAPWVAVTILMIALQIPVAGLRWTEVLRTLHSPPVSPPAVIAITATAFFFAQMTPTVISEGTRLWLVCRLGPKWQVGLQSLIVDRATGLLALLAFAIGALLSSSPIAELGGLRHGVIAVFTALLMTALIVIISAEHLRVVLRHWPMLNWPIEVTNAARQCLIVSSRRFSIIGLALLMHFLSLLAVWSLGKAQGLPLSLSDAAVLFTVMVGSTLIAISIAGWGVREVLVLTVLQAHGVSPNQAVLFSVGFGLCAAAASLPGLLAWILYFPKRNRTNDSKELI